MNRPKSGTTVVTASARLARPSINSPESRTVSSAVCWIRGWFRSARCSIASSVSFATCRKERGKKVNLLIRGEKTELDKRMIDELGDPLVHLVRNSIDHGLEPPDVRVGRGKPEVGTILLEASHSGNNVYIHVRDDGGGIDVERIKSQTD